MDPALQAHFANMDIADELPDFDADQPEARPQHPQADANREPEQVGDEVPGLDAQPGPHAMDAAPGPLAAPQNVQNPPVDAPGGERAAEAGRQEANVLVPARGVHVPGDQIAQQPDADHAPRAVNDERKLFQMEGTLRVPILAKRNVLRGFLAGVLDAVQINLGKAVPTDPSSGRVAFDFLQCTEAEHRAACATLAPHFAGLKTFSRVETDSRVAHGEMRKRKADEVSGAMALVDRLTKMRGTGGSVSSCQEYADRAMRVVELSARVASSGLRELRSSSDTQ
eukprot:TRINITY_DN90966_c0_g1_i1.p1 TRINITY_DN90966_c0_g1~~TRINITY_DN90966_c0_g1_i1.p1  ORF type:complete len:282 (-),score=38.34 TRINITY_DN90966_c0_g1_i1:219-1064(-)